MSITSGVYPVFDNTFKIETTPADATTTPATAAVMSTIADCTSFSVSVSNGIEEWTPMTTGGWARRLQTAKSLSITLSAKRCVGDTGNDYIAGLAWLTGQDTYSNFEWDLPNGDKVTFHCVVNVTGLGGESTAVDALEVEILSDGAVTYTPHN